MTLPLALLAFLALGPGNGEMQVRQILQIPAQPQQSIAAVATDSSGNLIATGQNGLGGFIDKIDTSGNLVFTLSEFEWYGSGVATDSNGDVYWIGTSGLLPFSFTNSVLGSPPAGRLPGFVVKFHGTDGSIVWSTSIGAVNPNAVAIGADGSIVIAGPATSTMGSATPGAYTVSLVAPATPVEIVKLSPAGTLTFAATYGGSTTAVPSTNLVCNSLYFYSTTCPDSSVAGVFVDPQSHIWIAGSTNVSDLPITPGALNATCNCASAPFDGYLAELSADGSQLLYGSYMPASSEGGAIDAAAMDAAGNIWLGGSTPANIVANGVAENTAAFIMKYVPSTNQVANEIRTNVNTTPTYVGNIALGSDGTVAIAGVPIGDPGSQSAAAQGFVETFNGNVPAGSGLSLTGLISLASNAVGTGLAAGAGGTFVVAGPASVATVLGPSGTVSPTIVSVTGSATTGTVTGQISPGQIITLFGYDLGPGIPVTAGVSGKPLAFPTSLAGVQVLVGSVPAPLLYVSETQINAIVPFGAAAAGAVTLTVNNNGKVSDSARLGVVTATPEVFTTQDTSQNISQNYPFAAALNQDSTINSSTNPAAPGSIVAIFATGLGALTTQPADGVLLPETGLPSLVTPVLLASGAQFLDILYAGPAPDEVAGAMQINFRLPATNPNASPILMFVDNWLSQPFTVWIAGN